ncbi:hypothetical protein niasHS_016320 [Heterodera schachtii]|uniref:Uncharacterized protein n=2 Tax=Heterodera TaxID=34509 RepID=A0ABD2I1H2_HETSC
MAWNWANPIKIRRYGNASQPVVVNVGPRKSTDFDFENIPPISGDISGFRRIILMCLDEKIVAFLHQIDGLFQNGMLINFENVSQNIAGLFSGVWSSIFKDKIYGMCTDENGIDFIRQQVPWPGDATNSAENALYEWLHMPSTGVSTPKILKCHTEDLVSLVEFRTAFASARSPSPCEYIIGLANAQIEPNELTQFVDTNAFTREHLQLILKGEQEWVLLIRWSIDSSTDWETWIKDAMSDFVLKEQNNLVEIDIEDE